MLINHYSLPQSTGEQRYWGNLIGAGLSLAMAEITQRHPGLVVAIVPNSLVAHQLEAELSFFLAATPECPVLTFPDWEILPYDTFSPHQDIVSERLQTLYRLPSLTQGILVVPITTLMQRLAPQSYIAATTLLLKPGDDFAITTMRQRLEERGYHCVGQVMEHGEFAVRGSLFDIFPMGADKPFRIDLFDQTIDSIRLFEPETQRTITTIAAINLMPAHEFPLGPEAITLFRQQWRERFAGNPADCPLYQAVSRGATFPGLEYYLPLFFPQLETLFDYLPRHSLVLTLDHSTTAAAQFYAEVTQRYEQRCHDITHPILPPAELFLANSELTQRLTAFPQITLYTTLLAQEQNSDNANVAALPPLLIEPKATQPLKNLARFLATNSNRILFCAESPGRREALADLLKTIGIFPTVAANWQDFLTTTSPLSLTVAPLQQGITLPAAQLTLITEAQLLGQQALQQRRRKGRSLDPEALIKSFTELQIGDPVVHLDYGVGRYLGLQTLAIGDHEAEYLTLEYANADKIYIPVTSLHLISRYSGVDVDHPPLHRLGTDQWSKAKRKAAEQVRDVAAELLAIYAQRAAKNGHAFRSPDNQYLTFAAAFPFETTPDQATAIAQIIQDMTADKPMDRLICGDVGFGKTEVAMRAAFLAVQDGKQVIVLVPTTLLASQHYENFKDRFADWPIHIELLSRFRSAKDQTEILKKLAEGKIDILIGTHKLLQPDVKFKALGLVIIDEEHRFGVQQKERFKALRAEIDMLALTATPIPRTLNFALSGVRELSIIATPPAKRLAIKTFVQQYDMAIIKEAIQRELLRGGQVYFLHNTVETIEKMARELQEAMPEIRIGIAHGQMRERQLEQVMLDFYHHRFNILVCTTIIESGIDVPTANTIIINRADKFGLAQLHQLRGRVGRSHHQAYAYLLAPPQEALTADAEKRLAAITSLEDLGVGFTLATHDLEIRGAGELLGEQQSGNMQAIGFSLYMEMLERAVSALKAGETIDFNTPLPHGTEIELALPALIPENYVPDVPLRLSLYKRIANATDDNALKELQVELIDRFGLLPQQVKNLFAISALKLQAQALGIRKITANATKGKIEFGPEPKINFANLLKLIQQQPNGYKLDKNQQFYFNLTASDTEIISTLLNLLTNLAE